MERGLLPARAWLIATAIAVALAGCARHPDLDVGYKDVGAAVETAAYVDPPVTPIVTHDRVPSHYPLDTGDQMRIYVFGQPELSRLYTVGPDGRISLPLIGPVRARGRTTRQLEQVVRAQLAASFVRDPYVAIEISTYRPFFILGEVRSPGQYPFVVGMTLDHAVAIAGGYSPRAKTGKAEVARQEEGYVIRENVVADEAIHPGDRITVSERWF